MLIPIQQTKHIVMKRLVLIMLCMPFGVEAFSQIVSAEYFFDADPGFGNGTALNVSGDSIDENFSIPTESLSDGIHTLYVRVLNANGVWSLYDKNSVWVSIRNANAALITAAEYFIDMDPGLGLGTAIDISGDSIDEDIMLDVPEDLSDGDHIVYVRVLNANGIWSLYARSNVSTLSDNEFDINAFKLYPNPVKDSLHFEANNHPILDFKIIDFTGKVVYNDLPNSNKINLEWLPTGAYLVQIKTENGSISKKIIKD